MIKAKDKLVGVLKSKQKLTSKLSIGTIREKYAPKYVSFYAYQGVELDNEVKNLDTTNVEAMNNMFGSCQNLKNLNLSNFDTSNVTNMNYMFRYCYALESLNLSNFNTSKVTSMQQMFFSCSKLTSLDLSDFDTSKVTSMHQMFNGCSTLKTLDLSNFDTSNVTNMGVMFCNCYKLTNVKELDASCVTTVHNIFYNCDALTNFGGLKNFGKSFSKTVGSNDINYTLNLSSCTKLTEQSLINVLNNLYDIKTKGCNTQSVVLGSTNLAKLTSEEGKLALKQAQDYGWNVT